MKKITKKTKGWKYFINDLPKKNENTNANIVSKLFLKKHLGWRFN